VLSSFVLLVLLNAISSPVVLQVQSPPVKQVAQYKKKTGMFHILRLQEFLNLSPVATQVTSVTSGQRQH